MESEEAAKARGARILAEVAGFGGAFDPSALNSFDPSGKAPRRALDAALREAGGSELDLVVAHGAGMPVGDLAEARAIGAGPAVTSRQGRDRASDRRGGRAERRGRGTQRRARHDPAHGGL